MTINPDRTLAELKELRALTADEGGAHRVAWTDGWLKARAWFADKLDGLPVERHFDAAGDHWITLKGQSEKCLIIGSHLDSVPGGGWLDGCLGVLTGLEIMRSYVADIPPVTIRLVDWADEEGARFGRSLLGSSAFAGNQTVESDRGRTDDGGIRLEDALRRCGVEIDRFGETKSEQANAAAYLELHIEQGPILETLGLPLGVVLGTKGVERHRVTFIGEEAHSGSTPMKSRKEALAAAAQFALEVRKIAEKHSDAVGTIGSLKTFPGIATAVVGRCELTLDQRDLSPKVLASMLKAAKKASERFAKNEKCEVDWSNILSIEPVLFDSELVELCESAVLETVGTSHKMPSGPLHDAAEVSRAGIPTAMMFVQSLRGISHNKTEDTKEEHLVLAVAAMARLASKIMERIAFRNRL